MSWLSTGAFYSVESRKYRSVLNVSHSSYLGRSPQLMVVMMNPGSSRPLEEPKGRNISVKAVADPTQDQIIKVCEISQLKSFRVINLSDLREPNSSTFCHLLNDQAFQSTPHSIFHAEREDELKSVWVENVPVLFAWGVNPALKHLAHQAMDKLKVLNPIGWKKTEDEWSYYHPLQRIHSKKLDWIEIVSEQLMTN